MIYRDASNESFMKQFKEAATKLNVEVGYDPSEVAIKIADVIADTVVTMMIDMVVHLRCADVEVCVNANYSLTVMKGVFVASCAVRLYEPNDTFPSESNFTFGEISLANIYEYINGKVFDTYFQLYWTRTWNEITQNAF